MKQLKSRKMKRLLQKGLQIASKQRAPSEGMLHSLFVETLRNGWHYQIDYIHDSRYREKKFVSVYAFKPPRFRAREATHVLTEKVD